MNKHTHIREDLGHLWDNPPVDVAKQKQQMDRAKFYVLVSLLSCAMYAVVSNQGTAEKIMHWCEGVPFTAPDVKNASSLAAADVVPRGAQIRASLLKFEKNQELQVEVDTPLRITPEAVVVGENHKILAHIYGRPGKLRWQALYTATATTATSHPRRVYALDQHGDKIGEETLVPEEAKEPEAAILPRK